MVIIADPSVRTGVDSLRVSGIGVLHLSTFFFFLAYGLVVPTLPLHLKSLGLANAWVGWAMALMPLAGLLLRPWGGHATDSWGRKGPTLLGLSVGVVSGIFYLGPLPLVLLARLLQGVATALFAPSTLAQTSDLAPGDSLGRIMGARNLLIGLGALIGTAVGGLLADLVGVRAVFLLMALVQLPWLLPLARLPETLKEPQRGPWWRGFLEAIGIPQVVAATAANTGFAASMSVLQAYYPIFLAQSGYTATWIGAFFALYGLISVTTRWPAGMAVDRGAALRLARLGFFTTTAGMALLLVWPLPWMAFVGGVVMGLGSGVYLPASIVVVTRATPSHLRGSAFSLFTASWDAGGLFGPPLAGLLVAAGGEWVIFPTATLIALTTGLFFAFTARRARG